MFQTENLQQFISKFSAFLCKLLKLFTDLNTGTFVNLLFVLLPAKLRYLAPVFRTQKYATGLKELERRRRSHQIGDSVKFCCLPVSRTLNIYIGYYDDY